jgi:hypothetical protein
VKGEPRPRKRRAGETPHIIRTPDFSPRITVLDAERPCPKAEGARRPSPWIVVLHAGVDDVVLRLARFLLISCLIQARLLPSLLPTCHDALETGTRRTTRGSGAPTVHRTLLAIGPVPRGPPRTSQSFSKVSTSRLPSGPHKKPPKRGGGQSKRACKTRGDAAPHATRRSTRGGSHHCFRTKCAAIDQQPSCDAR